MELHSLHGISQQDKTIKSAISEAYKKLSEKDTKEARNEQRIMAGVYAFLDDSDWELERELLSASAKSKHFQELYLAMLDEIRQNRQQMGGLPLIPGIAKGITAATGGKINVKDLIGKGVRSIFGGGDRKFDQNLQPGDTLTDSSGNIYRVGSEKRHNDFYVTIPGQHDGTGHMSSSRLAQDGSLYFISFGRNDAKRYGTLYKTTSSGDMRYLGRQVEWPADVTDFKDFSEANQQVQQRNATSQQPNITTMPVQQMPLQDPFDRLPSQPPQTQSQQRGAQGNTAFSNQNGSNLPAKSKGFEMTPTVWAGLATVAVAGLATAYFMNKGSDKDLSGIGQKRSKAQQGNSRKKASPKKTTQTAIFRM